MIAVVKILIEYFTKYVVVFRWIRVMLTPALILMLIANYIDILLIKCTMAYASASDKNKTTLTTIIICALLGLTLKLLVDLFSNYLISYSIRKAYTDFLAEFLLIPYQEFKKTSEGEKQNCINRRYMSLSLFFKTLLIHFFLNMLFFIWVGTELILALPITSAMKVIGAIAVFILVIAAIQYARSHVRVHVNSGLEKNGRKMFDVLFNYERIASYNNLDTEISKFFKAQYNQNFYNKIFWFTFNLGNLVTDILFCLLSIFVFYEYSGIEFASKNKALEKATMLSGLLKKLETNIKFVSREISTLMMQYVNFSQNLIEGVPSEEKCVEDRIKIDRFEQGIRTKSLAFSHDSVDIFENLNIEVTKGEKIAIAGVNGCGKSTFLKMLAGFYTYKGSLKIDGFEYENLDMMRFRRLIAYTPQDSQLMDTSIAENIKAGNEAITPDQIYAVCDKFNYHALFKRLGYDTSVGSRGKAMSGGERQKVAFMRAIAKDAPILLMDEPTASLDKNSEKEMLRHITTTCKDKTAFVIVHNLKSLKYFDRVIFFDRNANNDFGTFTKLMEHNGRFKEFYNASTKHTEI